jgi:hypothetical protein
MINIMSIFKNFIITDSEYRISPRIFTWRVILIIFGFIIAYLQIETKIWFIQILWKLCFLILWYTLFIQARKRINDYNGWIETQNIICTLFWVWSILYILEIWYPYSLWMIGIFFIVFCYILAISWPTPGNTQIKNNDYTWNVIWIYWKVFGQFNPFVMLYYFLRNLYDLYQTKKDDTNWENYSFNDTIQDTEKPSKIQSEDTISLWKKFLIVLNALILGPIICIWGFMVIYILFEEITGLKVSDMISYISLGAITYVYFIFFYQKLLWKRKYYIVSTLHVWGILYIVELMSYL